MSSIARLVWIFFTANPLTRGLFAIGLSLMLAGMAAYFYYPAWTLGTGTSQIPEWNQAVIIVAPWLGLILLFFASSTLPAVVERLLLGRAVYVLAGSRLSVLISVLATAVFIASLTATTGTLSFLHYPVQFRPENIFFRTWLVTFSNIGLMYLALWIVGKTRGIWLLLGSLLIALGVIVPISAIGLPSGVPPLTVAGLVVWMAFAAFVLFGARLRHLASGSAAHFAGHARRLLPSVSYAPGTELDLLLGTTRPWVVAIGQAVPVAAASLLIFIDLRAWLFFLTLFTAISGAITSTAAARSRVLWLRLHWTRQQIFGRVEAAYWRYNAYPLGVLLMLFVGFGAYREVSTPVLALGMALLVLGGIVSLYLGLMMTHGLRWLEILLGIGTMALLIWAAVVVADADLSLALAVEIELSLAALAFVFRVAAQARWNALDWLVCRDSALARGAG
jgi:hypothetical protein